MKLIKKISFQFEKSDLSYFYWNMSELGYKSISSLAKELKVSKQYLSSILNGKKTFSDKFYQKLKSLGLLDNYTFCLVSDRLFFDEIGICKNK